MHMKAGILRCKPWRQCSNVHRLRPRVLPYLPQALPTGGAAGARFIPAAAGLQLEIRATFIVGPPDSTAQAAGARVGVVGAGRFGLLVLAAANTSEYTAIGFDPAREQVCGLFALSGAACACVHCDGGCFTARTLAWGRVRGQAHTVTGTF